MKNLLGVVLLLINATALAAPVVNIPPSGDLTGATDQANIQAALDAAGSDTKARIKLAAGTFYLNGGVGVTGFEGTLLGSGKDVTEVIALGVGSPANRGSVFLFADGNATIKDLSIEVPDGSSYLDSHSGLFTSDGGAAIDIFGGSASIKNVRITSNGPFIPFGDESLETGVLLHNCDGSFELKDSALERVKRAVIFNPEAPSQCDIKISGNHFEDNRGGIFLLGGEFGFLGGNVGEASVTENTFDDTLVVDILGSFVEYPVDVRENEIEHSVLTGNWAIAFDTGSGAVNITGNETNGQYNGQNISLFFQFGSSVISGNTVNGASFGAISVELSDNVTIKDNDLTDNPFIPGWSVPGLETSGAYVLIESTNVRIHDEMLPVASQATCQVLHVPEKDLSNQIAPNLIECEAGL